MLLRDRNKKILLRKSSQKHKLTDAEYAENRKQALLAKLYADLNRLFEEERLILEKLGKRYWQNFLHTKTAIAPSHVKEELKKLIQIKFQIKNKEEEIKKHQSNINE